MTLNNGPTMHYNPTNFLGQILHTFGEMWIFHFFYISLYYSNKSAWSLKSGMKLIKKHCNYHYHRHYALVCSKYSIRSKVHHAQYAQYRVTLPNGSEPPRKYLQTSITPERLIHQNNTDLLDMQARSSYKINTDILYISVGIYFDPNTTRQQGI